MNSAKFSWQGILVSCTLILTCLNTNAQNAQFWANDTEGVLFTKATRQIVPDHYRYVSLDVSSLEQFLSTVPSGQAFDARNSTTVVDLPMPDGSSASFHIVEASIMEPALQAKFPSIRTYAGQGVEDPDLTVRFDLTPHGFHAMILGHAEGAVFVDPYNAFTRSNYIVYYKKDFNKQLAKGFTGCHYEDVNDPDQLDPSKMLKGLKQGGSQRVGDCQLRTYRLALSCTGEYANFHGSNTTNNDKSFAAAAMVTTMNRVNGIYLAEATLNMVIVANNDDLIFLDGSTDPFTNGSGGAMLGENQSTCNSVIGTSNYDIGHVFSTGGGGVASLRSPCGSNKANGVTGQGSPVNDPFDVDYVAHEMGHQYGGNHTQNNSCNRASVAAREPGSASTIMGYAGICSPNVQSNSDATFHGYSMQEIHSFITGSGNSCAQHTALSNNAPTANAGADHTIPAGTPFVLEGNGTDADASDVMSYKWDQMDNQVSTQPPAETSTGGPSFRSYVPQGSPDRYLPRLSDLVSGTDYDWEELSTVSRDFNFRLTVLDNAVGGGCNDQDDMLVTVDGTSGPFVVLTPNTAVSWMGNSNETVTWDVAGTDAGAVSTTSVDIFLSVDGGLSYPYTLITATANDGSQVVSVPDVPNTSSRIMVRGNGNIFFDISDQDFTIVQGAPDYGLSVPDQLLQVCEPTDGSTTVQVTSLLGFTDPVNLSTTGLPAGLSAVFGQSSVVPGNSTSLTISGTGSVASGAYGFDVVGSSTTGSKTLEMVLLVQGAPNMVVLSTPVDAATVSAGTALAWAADIDADSYDVEIASDMAFTNILESTSLSAITFSPAVANAPSTTYYWRVRATNTCATASWSLARTFSTTACVPVTVTVITDRYGSETTWEINDGTNTFASGGPYTDAASSGEYPQSDVNICLPAGCYSLVINDTFGDGICCSFGNGEISVVEDGSGSVLVSGGTFSNTISIGFEVGAVPTCIDPSAYLEDLDSGTCGISWSNVSGDDLDWSLNSGVTTSSGTGPSADHTSGSGNYYYTEASGSTGGDVALFQSDCIDVTGAVSIELSFWYHMLGPDIGTLELQANEGGSWNSYWTLSGDQGDVWTEANVSIPVASGVQQLRFRAEVSATGNAYQNDFAIDDISMSISSGILLSSKVFLEGPYDSNTSLMSDAVRAAGLVPLNEPYTGLGFTHVGGGGESTSLPVLNATGADAIIDWVLLELRDAADNTNVIATRSALLQADGDIVDVDGTSPVLFEVLNTPYFLAVRHRNHLGCMTSTSMDLGSGALLDLTSTSQLTYGTEARTNVSGVELLWMGNVVIDASLKYTGVNNDRDPILVAIGGSVPTATSSGYLQEDVTMDGQVKYTGVDNDRDPILVNVGGSVPTAVRTEQLP